MRYAITYDRAVWYPVPAAFPHDEWPDAAAWREQLVGEFEADMGELTEDARAAVRDLADSALASRSPAAHEMLLFCPRPLLAFGTASVYVASREDAAALTGRPATATLDELVADDDTLLPALVEEFTTEALGSGRRATVVLDGAGDRIGGGFTYAFERDDTLVLVTGAADGTTEAAMMSGFLDELVRGIRLEHADVLSGELA